MMYRMFFIYTVIQRYHYWQGRYEKVKFFYWY